MIWLATHIWMLLAAAGLTGLFLGLGIRGLMLGGKARRAMVERDVALTELDRAKSEIEALYAAQRQARPVPAVANNGSSELLEDRAREIDGLNAQLAEARREIESLKAERSDSGEGGSSAAMLAGAAAAGALAGAGARAGAGAGASDGAPAAPEDGEASLEWRNRYLESRVRRLEEELAAAVPSEASGAGGETAEPAPAEAADPGAGIDPTDLAKMRWQNGYMQTRVRVLEDKLTLATAKALSPVADGPEDVSPQATDVTPEHASASKPSETTDEEVARLRWRNRYLEGRLAYLEEGGVAPELEGTSTGGGAATLAAGALAAGAAAAEHAQAAVENSNDDRPASDLASDVPIEDAPLADVAGEAVTSEAFAGEPMQDLAAEDGLSDTPSGAAPEAELETGPIPEPEQAIDEADQTASDTLAAPEITEAITEEITQDIAPEHTPETELDGQPDPEPVMEPAPAVEAEASADRADDATGEAPETVEEAVEGAAEEAGELEAVEETADDETFASQEETDLGPEAALAIEQPPGIAKPRDASDDLTEIGGIGPRIQDVLNELGIYRFSQIAAWTPENEAWIDDYLSFSGRVGRELWVAQAQKLAADGDAN
ncbi:MAG: hypothetical protein AAGJ32_11635 [Pseudomonadota bacterium]